MPLFFRLFGFFSVLTVYRTHHYGYFLYHTKYCRYTLRSREATGQVAAAEGFWCKVNGKTWFRD
jgi:hypothetical protein